MSQPLSDKAELVTVVLKVRPLPGHPLFWKIKHATLYLWLYADSCEGARETAEQILTALPYEQVGDQIEVIEVPTKETAEKIFAVWPYTSEGDQTEVNETRIDGLARQFLLRKRLAEESGLSLLLIVGGLEADDNDFETFPL
jgi:hypothetical protein